MRRSEANIPRYEGAGRGHYESYFVRANHPDRALGFWLRYTIFAPCGDSAAERAEAELWAAVFGVGNGGEDGGAVSVYRAVPLAQASFAGDADGLRVRIGDAVLEDDPATGQGSARGAVAAAGHEVRWDLRYHDGADPVLLLAERLYRARLPKAKALVAAPLALFSGQLWVDGEVTDVAGWTGSQNHNWGSKHTDEYAWGQVAGFDNAPNSFMECSTARVHVAGVRTPWLTPVVLRHDGREYALNAFGQARRARGDYHATGAEYRWTLRSAGRDESGRAATVAAEFTAPAEAFVTFSYRNPPGGVKTCLNTKIGSCRVKLEAAGAEPVVLEAANRAAFEILS